jgi:hypothetical protein
MSLLVEVWRSTSAPRTASPGALSPGNIRFEARMNWLTRPGATPCASEASMADAEMMRSASPYSSASTTCRAARAAEMADLAADRGNEG